MARSPRPKATKSLARKGSPVAKPAAAAHAPILFVHWHADEARHLTGILAASGIKAELWRDTLKLSEVRAMAPRACVISLRRLPSHGRAVADALQSTKWARAIPLFFLDGNPDKLALTLERFPSARHATLTTLPRLLAALG